MSSPAAAATIAIRAESSPADPDSCKFVVDRTVHAGGPYLFATSADAAGSPLPERLFAVAGVGGVLVAENTVTVARRPGADWASLKRAVAAEIRAQLQSGAPALLTAPRERAPGDRSDDEVRAAIQDLLDREVNASIAAHGGRISIVEIHDRTLYVDMSGGCQGCAASALTLRSGLEVMVRRVAPEIVEIVDTTDHSAGARPYYRRP